MSVDRLPKGSYDKLGDQAAEGSSVTTTAVRTHLTAYVTTPSIRG